MSSSCAPCSSLACTIMQPCGRAASCLLHCHAGPQVSQPEQLLATAHSMPAAPLLPAYTRVEPCIHAGEGFTNAAASLQARSRVNSHNMHRAAGMCMAAMLACTSDMHLHQAVSAWCASNVKATLLHPVHSRRAWYPALPKARCSPVGNLTP